jgi:ribosomal protein S27AE
MAKIKAKQCPKCGHNKFLANQACRGTTTVVVAVYDSGPSFIKNNTPDGNLDPNDLDFDDPEGPFECAKCGAILAV